jgi:hypothetical protein
MNPEISETVVYVPAGGHPATQGIARGSAIVGLPNPGSDEVRIYFEGAIYGQSDMRTLADRVVHAFGRMLEDAPTTATRLVPRDALVAVGTFESRPGRIVLTGEQSAAAVASWLGVPVLDPAELRRGQPPRALSAAKAARLVPDIEVAVTRSLAIALVERAGLRCEGQRWIAPDGRHGSTSALQEALLWALVLIAEEG